MPSNTIEIEDHPSMEAWTVAFSQSTISPDIHRHLGGSDGSAHSSFLGFSLVKSNLQVSNRRWDEDYHDE